MAGAEDFSYLLQAVGGAYNFLGIGNAKKGIIHSIHTPGFLVR